MSNNEKAINGQSLTGNFQQPADLPPPPPAYYEENGCYLSDYGLNQCALAYTNGNEIAAKHLIGALGGFLRHEKKVDPNYILAEDRVPEAHLQRFREIVKVANKIVAAVESNSPWLARQAQDGWATIKAKADQFVKDNSTTDRFGRIVSEPHQIDVLIGMLSDDTVETMVIANKGQNSPETPKRN